MHRVAFSQTNTCLGLCIEQFEEFWFLGMVGAGWTCSVLASSARAEMPQICTEIESEPKKDPVRGVIGVQKGPLCGVRPCGWTV